MQEPSTINRAYERRQADRFVAVLPAAWQRRLLEALPAAVAWSIVTAPIWLALASPRLATLFVGVVVVFSAIRAIRFSFGAIRHAPPVRRSMETDWLSAVVADPRWPDYRVCFMIRAYREGNLPMLRTSLESIASSDWPRDHAGLANVEVIFATEEDDPITPPLVDQLSRELIGELAVRQIPHPSEPWVLPGPSSAMHYVGRKLFEEAASLGCDPRRTIVVDLDADTVLHPQYLACLMTHVLQDRQRDRHVYQPVVLFTLDYWRAPLHSRIAAVSTSVLSLGWLNRPEIAFTGAAATLDLYASVDFWPTDSHSQDSGVDLKLRMKYGDGFRVVGIPIPLKVYPVMAKPIGPGFLERVRSYVRSARLLFRQSARWREGPLDEFLEATTEFEAVYAVQRFFSGLERDTLSILPSLGVAAVGIIGWSLDPAYQLTPLAALFALAVVVVTGFGVAASWNLLSEPRYVGARVSWKRRIFELGMFMLGYTVYLPLLTSAPCLKTATAYALGKRPNGHYAPTPK